MTKLEILEQTRRKLINLAYKAYNQDNKTMCDELLEMADTVREELMLALKEERFMGMSDIQIKIWEILENLSGEDVARLFTNFYGNQLLTEEFMEFIEEEGYSY